MDHPVNTFFKFDECSIRRHIPNLSRDTRTNGILVLNRIPRIRFELTNSQRNLLLLLVDAKDDCLNFLPLSQKIGGSRNSLSPRELRNMNQAFDALLDFNKSSIGDEIRNLAAHCCSNGETFFDSVPRIALGLFEAEGYTLLFLINVENNNIDLLTYL